MKFSQRHSEPVTDRCGVSLQSVGKARRPAGSECTESNKTKNILIVDDDAAALKLAALVVHRAGYTTTPVSDCNEARAFLRETRPAAILLDMHLCETSGLDFAQEIRANGTAGHARIIAMSAYPDEMDLREVFASGCDAFMAKPLMLRNLPDHLAELLPDSITEMP